MTTHELINSLTGEQLAAYNAEILSIQSKQTAMRLQLATELNAQVATLQAACDAACAERDELVTVLGGTEAGQALIKQRKIDELTVIKESAEAKLAELSK